jgi:glucosamine--fructose-6-phosphate aminotransferase (isomerizing)
MVQYKWRMIDTTICKKCIIPASFPGITFKDGLCSYCAASERTTVNRSVKGHNELKRLLESRKGKDYDCLVPTGGGKDSSYVLYYVVKELGLKPLVFCFDNGFIVDFAKRNLEKICNRLSVDLVVAKSTDFRRKAAIEAVRFSNSIHQFSASMLCANCINNALTAAKDEAARKKIPFIIWGHSRFEGFPSEFDYGTYDVTGYTESAFELDGHPSFLEYTYYISSYYNLIYCRNSADYLNALIHRWLHEYYVVRDNVATNPSEGWSKFLPFWKASWNSKKVQSVGFFDYIPYDPFRTTEILKKEIGWQAPPDRETRNDCLLHCLGNFTAFTLTGLTRDGFFLANLVRQGMLTRDEAVGKEEATKKNLEKECQEALKAMGLNNDMTDKILHSQEFVTNRRNVLLRLKGQLSAVKRLLSD